MAAHAAALSLLLIALMPIIGTTGQFSADEGAAIAQALQLERGDGWTTQHPFPAADPDGTAYPLELSVQSGARYAPFAKHPAYPVLLAAADRVLGRAGMVLLSIGGTVTAALMAALLARRLDPALALPAMWAAGLASPLFFDGFLVIAHTLGAACAGAAALCAVRATETRRWLWWSAGVVVAFAVGTLLRTEMPFLAVALSIALLLGARRAASVRWLVVAAPVAGSAAGWLLDRFLLHLVVPGAASLQGLSNSSGFVASRVLSFVVTWLLPSYTLGVGDAVLLGAVVMGAVAARLARTRPAERDGVRLFAVVAAGAGFVRLFLGTGPVPGLLFAFPLVLIGAVATSRRALSNETARTYATAFGLFALAVLATQYAGGGFGEWGGRYFAIGLPLLVPVLLAGVLALGRTLDRTTAKVAGASLVALSVALSGLAVTTLREAHQDTDAMVAAVDATARSHPAVDGGAPVVLSPNGAAGRFAFHVVERTRWLTVPDERLDEYARRLRDLHVGPVTFVTRERDDLDRVAGLYAIDTQTYDADGWIVLVLRPI